MFGQAYLLHSMMLATFRQAGIFQEQSDDFQDRVYQEIPTRWLKGEKLKR